VMGCMLTCCEEVSAPEGMLIVIRPSLLVTVPPSIPIVFCTGSSSIGVPTGVGTPTGAGVSLPPLTVSFLLHDKRVRRNKRVIRVVDTRCICLFVLFPLNIFCLDRKYLCCHSE